MEIKVMAEDESRTVNNEEIVMVVEDETITLDDTEIQGVNNPNALSDDGACDNRSETLDETGIVHDDEAKSSYDDDIIMEENTGQADTTLEKENVSGSLIGFRRKTVEEMYELYCKHAHEVGFSVRKGTSRYNNNKLVEKYYLCSSSGQRESKKSDLNDMKVTKRVHITRTGCKAFSRVKLKDDGYYEVIDHFTTHNHGLTRKEWSHLHRSERKITYAKGNAIEGMTSSGIKPAQSFRCMVHDAGGEEYVGHTLRDHMNFVGRSRKDSIEGGDANTLIEMLYDQAAKENDFFFRIKHDGDGRLCSIFWRDSMMSEDYNIYGDVVVFDTTYRTNKYDLICAPFVGINNHWRNVMFACAFLADEKTVSFEWLFEVFKKSMGGKNPITIFTDQDPAISNAIAKVFPQTRHRLCIWHLHQNAISQFGNLKKSKPFKDLFNKCIRGCDDEMKFESCWRSMITKYELENNPWFARMYKLKDKWCTALNKDFFSAGILSSQRSESTNSVIGFNTSKTTNLTDFYVIFKDTLNRWRSNETQDEVKCLISIPQSTMPMLGMLKHASEVYTLTLFVVFEEEYIKGVSCMSNEVDRVGGFITYNVAYSEGRDHRVLFDAISKKVSCTCKKFEECGLLCYHCLRVLNLHSVCEIPQEYILKRWTKVAKSGAFDQLGTRIERSDHPKYSISWLSNMTRTNYNMLLECLDDEDARKIVEDGSNKVLLALKKLKDSRGECSNSSNGILDPARSTTKGRKKRIKGHFQKNTKKRTPVVSNEIGSKTPNVRLF